MFHRVLHSTVPSLREGECSGEGDVVLHLPCLEMSVRDQILSTLRSSTQFFDNASRVFAIAHFAITGAILNSIVFHFLRRSQKRFGCL